jgi:hypothetical protein
MKKFITKKLGGAFIALFGLIVLTNGSVIAETATSSTSGTTQTTPMNQRISSRKNELKLQLTTAQSQNLAKKCISAQKRVKSIAAQDASNANKRQQVYTNISARLAKVVDGLSKQGVGTAELTSLQQRFNTSANQYLIDASEYETTIDDLSVMDCAADPTGFEATLTSARQSRIKLASDIGQVASAKTSLAQAITKATAALNSRQGAK